MSEYIIVIPDEEVEAYTTLTREEAYVKIIRNRIGTHPLTIVHAYNTVAGMAFVLKDKD